jgi:hypothetical protein
VSWRQGALGADLPRSDKSSAPRRMPGNFATSLIESCGMYNARRPSLPGIQRPALQCDSHLHSREERQTPVILHSRSGGLMNCQRQYRATRSMNLAEKSSRRAPQKAIESSASRRICAAPTRAICLRRCWLQAGLTNSMLKHRTQQLMLKSEKYFMKLVSHRRAPYEGH